MVTLLAVLEDTVTLLPCCTTTESLATDLIASLDTLKLTEFPLTVAVVLVPLTKLIPLLRLVLPFDVPFADKPKLSTLTV